MKEAKVSFVDFTARKEVIDGMEYLTIYLEYSGERDSKVIQRGIHETLRSIDGDYANLTDFFDSEILRDEVL